MKSAVGYFRLFLKACACGLALLTLTCLLATGQSGQNPPTYRVDPAWPKELPHNWIIGQVGGLTVDSHNHIWVLHRPRTCTPDELGAAQTPQVSMCCYPAPPVLEFVPCDDRDAFRGRRFHSYD